MAQRNADIARAVERQMRNWEIARSQHLEKHPPTGAPIVADFVTVSRMVGSGGGSVARALGKRLGWPVFDRDVLQHMAGDEGWRKELYERLDERDVGWIEEILRWVLLGDRGSQGYVRQLTETMLALARQGSAIFLGRGAEMILPPDAGLRVRIIAPPDQCIAHLAQRQGLSDADARAEFDRIQTQRDEYMRTYFQVKPGGAPQHDVVLSMRNFDVDAAVDVILAARAARRAPASPDPAALL